MTRMTRMTGQSVVYVGAEQRGLYRKVVGAGGAGGAGNGGEWTQLTAGLTPGAQVRALTIHPRHPEVVYAGTQRGVYKSTDRGDAWQRTGLPEGRVIWSIAFHPLDPGVLYAGTEGSELWESRDGGESWTYLSTPTNPDTIEASWSPRIMSISVDPSRPETIYVAIEIGGVMRSDDAGRTWQVVTGGFVGDVDLMDLHAVAVGGKDAEAVFLSNRLGIWRSTNRGGDWENLHLERASPIVYSRGVRTAPDDPDTLYACVGGAFSSDDGGLMRSTDLGQTWQRIDKGIKGDSTTFGVTVNQQDPRQVFFVSRQGQVFGTWDGGESWTEDRLPQGVRDVASVACATA
jgi:photosystem II stability/assembly factor-like uncharacterized protein